MFTFNGWLGRLLYGERETPTEVKRDAETTLVALSGYSAWVESRKAAARAHWAAKADKRRRHKDQRQARRRQRAAA